MQRFEPFILASQADQVSYIPNVSKKRKKVTEYAVIPIKSHPYIEEHAIEPTTDALYQEHETIPHIQVSEEMEQNLASISFVCVEDEVDDQEDEEEEEEQEEEETNSLSCEDSNIYNIFSFLRSYL